MPTEQPESNTLKSIVRGLSPLVISAVASVIAHFGYHVSLATTVQILGAASAVLVVVLHSAERKFPWVGAALGWLGAPLYTPSVKTQQAATIAQLQAQVSALTATKSEAVSPSPPSYAPAEHVVQAPGGSNPV